MRNLKKFLALILAFMMAFSLMVTVNAANITATFDDADSVNDAFTEAVDVLNGMKVFEGYADKTFKPRNSITRAEVATIVYRLATGDAEGNQAHLYKDYKLFSDVKSTDWFAGYVNYCANAEWIKGYDGQRFGPNDKVTGYQAAAMILRAVGYGKNNEFSGPGWQVQVANTTRYKGLLVNVDKTTYANTLNQPATRELVAEILFQAAQIPTVTWTMLNGYSEYDNALSIGNKNLSLGRLNYGLTYGSGIIVANQDTGVTTTNWRTSAMADGSSAMYSGGTTLGLKMTTGLAQFGHNYKMWYDQRPSNNKTVYAAYDNVVSTQLVYAINADLNDDATEGSLGRIIADGRIDLKRNATKDAFFSIAFGDITTKRETASPADDNGVATTSAQNLYLAISNSSNKNVDLVVSVNAQINRISRVDNLPSVKTLDVGVKNPAFNTTSIVGVAGRIDQDLLFGSSCKTLNANVVANAINTTDDAARAADGYVLNEMKTTVVGTVSATHTGSTANLWDRNFDPDYVIVDGEKIEKSLLHYENAPAPNNDAPQIDPDGVPGNMNLFVGGTYRFYLDADGKYMACERVFDQEFIYGTYADYEQATSTSSFNYYLTGVTLKGEVVTRQFNAFNGAGFNGDLSRLLAPYRAHNMVTGSSSAVANRNLYNGFVLGNTSLSDTRHSVNPESLGVHHEVWDLDENNNPTNVRAGTYVWHDGPVRITKRDADVGALQVASIGDGVDTYQINGAGGTAPVFITSNTQFYLVSGNGTDTVAVADFKGLTDLMDGDAVISILDNRDTQFYYTTKDFYYATNNVYAKEIETIILPASAIQRNSSAYFVSGNSRILNDADNANIGKYALYLGGERVEAWLDISNYVDTDGTAVVFGDEGFNILVDSGLTANDGEPVYRPVAIADRELPNYGVVNDDNALGKADGNDNGELAYLAATRDATVATFDGKAYNVASAEVVNFVSTVSISTIQDLNEASTWYQNCNVFAVSGDGVNVDVIYVMEVNTPRA